MLLLKIKTALALGLPNILRVASYRLSLRNRFSTIRRIKADTPKAPFFLTQTAPQAPASSSAGSRHQEQYFGWQSAPMKDKPPDWHLNPITGKRFDQPQLEWWKITDFDNQVGDIKTLWEASRFGWAIVFAQQAAAGDTAAVSNLNHWLSDWLSSNPPYYGPNWKCGQEASIRVLNLAVTALITNQIASANIGLIDLVELHLQRIAPTLSYAIGQDNNHGTSEAAALLVGGSWLMRCNRPAGSRWASLGRRWLENRAARLISHDGSFSQYSTNYHRLMLDTLSIAEVWRRRCGLPSFSEQFQTRSSAAACWLAGVTSPVTGDAPNLGANDGAHLLRFENSGYRDFRPSVQLAMALFNNKAAYRGEGPWNAPLNWLNIDLPATDAPPPTSRLYDNGGYAVLHRHNSMVLLRYARFQYRPSHADLLHVDLWINGVNHLRDGGTYSYNTAENWLKYFPGTASHNTVQFDQRDQMPRLGRFLFGGWLKTDHLKPPAISPNSVCCQAGYHDAAGASHKREVLLEDQRLTVRDQIEGFTEKAVLRWRLMPGTWRIDGDQVTNGSSVIKITADDPIDSIELTTGWESRYYLQKAVLPVVEVTLRQASTVVTEYIWSP